MVRVKAKASSPLLWRNPPRISSFLMLSIGNHESRHVNMRCLSCLSGGFPVVCNYISLKYVDDRGWQACNWQPKRLPPQEHFPILSWEATREECKALEICQSYAATNKFAWVGGGKKPSSLNCWGCGSKWLEGGGGEIICESYVIAWKSASQCSFLNVCELMVRSGPSG